MSRYENIFYEQEEKEAQNELEGCFKTVVSMIESQATTKFVHRWREKTILQETCFSNYKSWFALRSGRMKRICREKPDTCHVDRKDFEDCNEVYLKRFNDLQHYANDEEYGAFIRKIARLKKIVEITNSDQ
eukprot:TRINITY_DN11462_c0_g1_i1.p1 TRINITY_DN11462_c0_g1~~TRINITY_DN11462_c0_g1_i1.p1  ORF type:complete len:131 (+),score=25.07 TRINITY_DN11462_c0_g1_i1:151-543(+)